MVHIFACKLYIITFRTIWKLCVTAREASIHESKVHLLTGHLREKKQQQNTTDNSQSVVYFLHADSRIHRTIGLNAQIKCFKCKNTNFMQHMERIRCQNSICTNGCFRCLDYDYDMICWRKQQTLSLCVVYLPVVLMSGMLNMAAEYLEDRNL